MDNAERLLKLIRAMNDHGPSSVVDLNRSTGISRPAIYRLINILLRNGYVRRIPDESKFEFTSEIMQLSSGFRDRDSVVEAGRPVISRLQKSILWPTSLSTFEQGYMIIRETTRYTSPFVFDTGHVGLHLPVLSTASGLAYLAFTSSEQRRIIIEMLKQSEDPWDAPAKDEAGLKRVMNLTRDRGYSFRSGGVEERTSTIALPILADAQSIGSICVTFATSVLPMKRAIDTFFPLLKDAAAEINSSVTHQPR